MQRDTLVEVAVALPVHGTFTYALPPSLSGLGVGSAVLVAFGHQRVTGYVVGLPAEAPVDAVKPVLERVEPDPVFDAAQLAFFRWIAEYYRAPLGEVIATALPTRLKARGHRELHPTPEGVDALAARALEGSVGEVLREVISRPGLTRAGLERRLRDLLDPKDVRAALRILEADCHIVVEEVDPQGPGDEERVVRLAVELPVVRGERQRAVVAALVQAHERTLPLDQIVAEQGPYARAAIRALSDRGVVSVEHRPRLDPVAQGELPEGRGPPALTEPQEAAVQAILGPPRAWLLHGVTGAGKTEVYLRAAQAVRASGRQVLVLVPEIGLTPLLTGRFRARFGDDVAVLHSRLSPTSRLREWRRIRHGEANVAVGARSALFAPFHDLGLIVVDEEHDDSYKQDDGVRYNARDLAVVLGKERACPVVLGSATPSLESYANAQAGRYGLLELLTRPTPRPVPDVEVVDMNREPRDAEGKVPLLSAAVVQALTAALEAGGKAIILYNRRGYATLVQCPDCGGSYNCPSCGVALVLHANQQTLTCHYCGFHRPFTSQCPACSGTLDVLGRGTERVEEEIADAFPGVPIGRMDADTTAGRGAHHRILEDFRVGATRLLVGTQIVAKGHDFPDVHCAVVLGADHVLRMPDFRAAERTMALLTQLAGRAGRGEVAGRVLVQTHHPHHFVLRSIGQWRQFYDEEMRVRELLGYPPLTRLVLVRVEAEARQAALDVAWAVARSLRTHAEGRRVQVLGPAPAALPRLVGRWRFQVLMKGRSAAGVRHALRHAHLEAPGRGVRVVVDVDPRSLM